jgi:hypothetical protein
VSIEQRAMLLHLWTGGASHTFMCLVCVGCITSPEPFAQGDEEEYGNVFSSCRTVLLVLGKHSGNSKFEAPSCPVQSRPLDFRLCGPLKGALRGHRFASDVEGKRGVHIYLRVQPK